MNGLCLFAASLAADSEAPSRVLKIEEIYVYAPPVCAATNSRSMPWLKEKFIVPIVLDQDVSIPAICLNGDVNIVEAQEVKSLLLQALNSGKELRIRLEDATGLDITALQLLYAAQRAAAATGAPFTFEGLVPTGILLALRNAGLDNFPALTN